MKTTMLAGTVIWLAASALAADADPKAEVTSAAKKLGDQKNYSWHTSFVVPEGSPFRPGPMDGKTEKDGYALVTMSFNDNPTKVAIKGDKRVVTNPEGEWLTPAQMDESEGPIRFVGLIARNLKLPAVQSAEVASYAKSFKKDGDALVSEMTEEGAKKLMTWRPIGNGDGPTVSNASGSMKFWLKAGALVKYEFKLKGTISFNGNDFENDRTSIVEIKDVDATKVEVPEAAKKKLS